MKLTSAQYSALAGAIRTYELTIMHYITDAELKKDFIIKEIYIDLLNDLREADMIVRKLAPSDG